jgi:hypothetical protein
MSNRVGKRGLTCEFKNFVSVGRRAGILSMATAKVKRDRSTLKGAAIDLE